MITRDRWRQYPFIELSLACSDVTVMEDFWVHMFDGEVLFRGTMFNSPFSRILVCGVTLVFRQDPDFKTPPGPGKEFFFRNHIGLRVKDLKVAIDDLESRGAQFVLKPHDVIRLQKQKMENGGTLLSTSYIAPPLTKDRVLAGEYHTDVSILVGPDHLWIEINEIKEPSDTQWFPGEPIDIERS
jgi:hypothetical protein